MADDADNAQQQAELLAETIARFATPKFIGESLTECDECGNDIPEARRIAAKGCTLCIECQRVLELKNIRMA